MRAPTVLFVLLVPLAAGTHIPTPDAPVIQNDPADLVAGARLALQTDATGGKLTLYQPSPHAGSCHTLHSSQATPPDGTLPILLDVAGTWILEHTVDGAVRRAVFEVQPAPLRVPVSAKPTPTGMEYHVTVARGAEEVPHAYVDVLDQDGAVVRHLRADNHGQLRIHEAILPYTGNYALQAYRDDGDPRHEYSTAYTALHDPPCDGSHHVPELFGGGPEPGTDTVSRHPQTLHVAVDQGVSQVRGIQGTSLLDVTTPGGQPVTPSRVTLLVDGRSVDPTQLDLTVTVSRGHVAVDGVWDASGDIVVELVVDVNRDHVPEYHGAATVRLRQEVPLRIVPDTSDGSEAGTLSYHVPEPLPDGRPGVHVLRFRIKDQEGVLIVPPALDASDIAVEGDVLPGARIQYDAGAGYWIVEATPLGSDADYEVIVRHEDAAVVTRIETPPGGGAKATLMEPAALEVGRRDNVRVTVERFNPDAIQYMECQPRPSCAYEAVTDAFVYLAWADTGEPVVGPSGLAYAYRPGSPPSSCDCYQYRGEYVFLDVQPKRSGLMVAVAKINVQTGDNVPHWAYQPIHVEPEPVFSPRFVPSKALAGQHTRFQLESSGLSMESLHEFKVYVLDDEGRDVTMHGELAASEAGVYWTANLAEGQYRLFVEDRLDATTTPPLLGLRGTLAPGVLEIVSANIQFTYTEFPESATIPLQGHETSVLGASLGDVVQLAIAARGPLGEPVLGTIHLDALAGDPPTAFALMALSNQNEPQRFGAPRLFAPSDPDLVWMCDDPLQPGQDHEGCQSYFFQQAPTPQYVPRLDLEYLGTPILVYVYGVGLGDVDVDFTPAGSIHNTRQNTQSTVHVIPPHAAVTSVSGPQGVSRDGELAVGVENLVILQLWDPTGVNDLDGREIALGSSPHGPSQRPTGILRNGSVQVALVPDATGRLGVFVVDAPAATATGLELNVKHSRDIVYVDVPGGVFIDAPGIIEEGERFTVRVATTHEPFPQGVVVEAFGQEVLLVSGTGSLAAPSVDEETRLPLLIRVPGHQAVTRFVTVLARPDNLAALAVEGIPATIDEGGHVKLRVRSGDAGVEGAVARLLGIQATSDASGRIAFQVPRVDADAEAVLTILHPGYLPHQATIGVLDAARPRLELEVPGTLRGGQDQVVFVHAVDELGQAIPIPRDAIVTIEVQRAYELEVDGLVGSWTYQAPELRLDTRVYAFAHAPGFESDKVLVSIKAVPT